MKNAIEIKDMVKKYDENFQLGSINLNIPSGCIVGLIGENGAGKTTLLKTILNIISIDQGKIKIFNKDYKKEEKNNKQEIGVVLDNMFFPEILSVKDIDLIMKDIYKKWDSSFYFTYLEQFKIPINKKIKMLSKGMRKKLEIITALSHHPKLLILDEATSGLDPVVRNEILDLFLKFLEDEEHTILFSTHITSDLEHIADQIVFIDQGRIVLEDTRDSIMDTYGILKCDKSFFESMDKKDILAYQKNAFAYHILVKEREKMKKKYKNILKN